MIDVPELVGALASRFRDHGVPTREAAMIALCMLVEAMDDPEQFELQIDDPLQLPAIH